jgi:hypothetical protein
MDEPLWDGTRDQVRDSSGQGHHGTSTPGATTVANGRFGRGGTFGSAGCIELVDVPDLRPNTQLTVSAWAFPNSLSGAQGVVAKRRDFQFDSAYALFFLDGRLYVDINNDRFAANPVFAAGGWYHLALVFDGSLSAASRVTTYVNAAAVFTGSENASSIAQFAAPLWVGCLAETNPSQAFPGVLDEVAIWHRALTSAEINALATATGPLQ